MPAMIRLFCPVGVGDDLGLRYALAWRKHGRAIRVFPLLGGAVFSMPGSPWRGYDDMFLSPVTHPYINVVCSGPGFTLGRAIKASELVPDPEVRRQMGLDRHEVKLPDKTSDEDVFTPNTALGMMHTAEARANVAITSTRPVYPNRGEVANLLRYDAVLCPAGECTYRLIREGLTRVQTIPPDRDDLIEAAVLALERATVMA